ncbi:MAG: type II toxin-antitoxin system RelE/ParE family toxin [Bacteroidales bacterium]|nr:type II toxin-antitoxin system RelE/ParE family toxin [Bacteroidales bacterium]
MKLIWEKIALRQLKQVAGYIEIGFGSKRKVVFLREVKHITELLLSNPYIGALEPVLSERSKSYRSILVCNMDRMVYYVDDNNIIHISAFWDCRSDAGKQTRHLA